MPNPTTTATKAPTTATKKEAWYVSCSENGVDCPFHLRTHDKRELVTACVSHGRNVHNMDMAEKDVLAAAKPAKW